MLNDVALVIVSFLGLIIGMIIAKFTKEELKQGKKYFILIKKTILLIIAIILLNYSYGNYIWIIPGLVIGYFLKEIYFYLGLALSLSFIINQDLFTSTLIFLFGLPEGTLIYYKNKPLIKKTLLNLILFLIPFIVLLTNLGETLLPFVAGALLINIR